MQIVDLLPQSCVGVDEPWLVIARPGNPQIRLNAKMLDHIDVVELSDQGQSASGLHMAVEAVDVQLHIADGAEAAQAVVDRLASFTRFAPITRVEAYEEAKRRLQAHRERGQSQLREVVLLLGTDVVTAQGHCIRIGDLVKYRISEVENYAQHAADLPLPNGTTLQAAMALLVVPAAQRMEDIGLLSERIAAYERHVRSGGAD